MTKRTEFYLVKLTRPGRASYSEVEDYLLRAIVSERGTVDPTDAMCDLNRESVFVQRATVRRLGAAIEHEKFLK